MQFFTAANCSILPSRHITSVRSSGMDGFDIGEMRPATDVIRLNRSAIFNNCKQSCPFLKSRCRIFYVIQPFHHSNLSLPTTTVVFVRLAYSRSPSTPRAFHSSVKSLRMLGVASAQPRAPDRRWLAHRPGTASRVLRPSATP